MFDLTWYNSLNHPPLTPPYWIFAPVWTVLYLSMFVSLVVYALKPSDYNKIKGYILFFAGLIINLCWSPAFFLFHNPTLALILILILDILVILNIKEFSKVSKKSVIFLLPYLIWILFATYLNAGIVFLN